MENNKPEELNFAGKLANTFIESKLTMLIIIGILLVGVVSLMMTPREYNPQITVPAANIMVMKPGANSEEVHNLVVKPLEALLNALPGVEHTYGYATNDFGMVTVAFTVGEDQEKSLVRVYNQIMQNMDRLPPGTMHPMVKPINVDDVPIFSITMSSHELSASELRVVATGVLEKLRSVPGVSITDILGGTPRAVQVWLDPAKMEATGLSLDQVDQMLRASSVDLPSGEMVQNGQVKPVRVMGALGSAEEVGDLIVGAPGGRPVHLREVAEIVDGPLEGDIHARFSWGGANADKLKGHRPEAQAITVTMAKKAGTNAVLVSQAIEAKLEEIREYALPEGVTVVVTRNDGEKADAAVNLLVEHLVIAIATVILILVVFLGWREAMIVTLTVPLILLIVLSIGYFMGQSINRITLFALILALGLLVDDSIVVIENIHRHLHGKKHKSFKDAIVAATNEIGNPTNVATVAVMLAFLPMAFVTGMMGPFMMPIPFNVPVAMLASLLIAYITVPWIARRWLKGPEAQHDLKHSETLEEKGEHQEDFLHRLYVKYFTPYLHSRKPRVILTIGIIAGFTAAMLQPAWQFFKPDMSVPLSPLAVDLKMLPFDNTNTFLVEINTPEGTASEETDRIARQVGELLTINGYVENFQTYLGSPAPIDFAAVVRGDMVRRGANFAQIRINLVDKHDRSLSSHELLQQLHKNMEAIKTNNPTTKFKLYEEPPGPPVQSQIIAEIYGPDLETIRETGKKVEALFEGTYGMMNVDKSVTDTVVGYKIRIDRQRAMAAGVAPAQAAMLLHNYLAGTNIGAVRESSEREVVALQARLPKSWRGEPKRLLDLKIRSINGALIPLSAIAYLDSGVVDQPIYSRDQHAMVRVTGELIESSPAYAVMGLDKKMHEIELVEGFAPKTGNLGFVATPADDLSKGHILWEGEMRLTLDTFRDMGSAFIVALILIYLLLVGYYKDFLLPVIVMGAIPLTMIGVFPGHFITGQAFTATSMIGVIALAGIVVRNSLLLIDFILEYRKAGNSLEASVVEAGAARFRPIVLTALAIIMGSAIMITDPVFGGLAVSLIFGTFVSTALTLIVIPLTYYLWQKGKGAD
ncbi:efflux RND transporter permease subunit [Fibrobacterales bacterium]|nr:efflux RND transporter permease subunit [Fibrobacterales bacterium]